MGPEGNIDVGKINQASIDKEMQRWLELEVGAPNGPNTIEFKLLTQQAKSILTTTMPAALNSPDGFDIFVSEAEKLNELYEKAVELRTQNAGASLRESFGVTGNSTVEQVLDAQADKVADELGRFGKPISDEIQKWTKAFAVEPADILGGANIQGNRFWMRFNGTVGPNFEEVDKVEKFVNEVLLKIPNPSPAVLQVVNSFQAGIRQLRSIDARRELQHRIIREQFGLKMNLRPVRVVLGMLGALITTVGLGQTLFTKGHQFSPATGFWGLVTLAATHPHLLSGLPAQTVASMQRLGTKDADNVLKAGFKGEIGANALEELQGIAKTNGAFLKQLVASKEPITIAQIGALTGSKDSTLTKLLTGMSQEDRRNTLAIFGKQMDIAQQDFEANMLRMRDTAQAQL